MTRLADLISVDRTKLRSINIERDLDEPDALDGYVLSARAAEGVQRIAATNGQSATRAWSVAGPYGSGKSAFAHLLCGLFAPKSSPMRRTADRVLKATDPEALKGLRSFRRAVGADERGMIRAVATAGREPAGATVLRALSRGCDSYWSGRGRRPRVMLELERELQALDSGAHLDPRRSLELVDGALKLAPVLLIVDEFGKCLEFAAQDSAEGDLFLLQQLAERLSGGTEVEGLLLTLQHLAFEDYIGLASSAQRREWRKVQGRFEELPFANDEELGWRLVRAAISPASEAALGGEVSGVIDGALKSASAAGAELSEAFVGLARECYPLHPLALWILPELASRFGQGERTLAHFLTGESPGSLAHFIDHVEVGETYPLLRIHDLFDFFVGGGGEGAGLGEEGARLREVQLRLEEANELAGLEARLAKTIAALNLVSSGGTQRAARATVTSAAAEADEVEAAEKALKQLEQQGIVVYREFADEYRVWRGSDFDVAASISAEREQLEHSLGFAELPVDEIARAQPLRPAVAARHSQQTGTLRFFERRYVTRLDGPEATACSRQGFDGLVLLLLGTVDGAVPPTTPDGRPLMVIRSPFGEEIRASALDAAASLRTLKTAKELETDPVARAEVRHRTAQAQALLSERMSRAFEPSREGVEWYADGVRIDPQSSGELSRLLSDLCDRRYPKTPLISSEMLNRHELTSQGAKARRELVGAMFKHPTKERLGLEGFGPERAMYEAVFASTRIHRSSDGQFGFGKPDGRSGLSSAWTAIERFCDEAKEQARGLDELYEQLLAPPFGMKEGPIPLLITAVLQARAEDVLVYEEGTFQPRLGPEHVERMMKTPARFGVKRLALEGARAGVLGGIRDLLSSPGLPEARNADALSVVRPLILFAQGLPEYTRQTSRISDEAKAVREALFATREPDELLFSALPRAVGYEPLRDGEGDEIQPTSDVTAALAAALRELEAAYPALLDHAIAVFREAFAAKGPPGAVREDLRTRSRHLVDAVIEPQMRSFLLMASDEELDEREWVEALAMNVRRTPPQGWSDADIMQFEAEVNERAQWFRRLELLHYEMAVKPRKGYDVRRLTVTAPDGEETSELAWIDRKSLPALHEFADDALARLQDELGPRSAEALIAVLAERIAADTEEVAELEEEGRLDSAV